MKFSELDSRMRQFEENDKVLPGTYMVARLDGRGFTGLTKSLDFSKPYDDTFSLHMLKTVQYLMEECGFKVEYGYTQSDEISLLFGINEDMFNRKIRKFTSVLAGEASAKFSILTNKLAAFDCRIVTLPSPDLVIDYFRWRQEDANRNCIQSYCHHKLLEKGKTSREAASVMNKKSIGWMNEFLFQEGINYDKLPDWQKRGVGVYWVEYRKSGYNPKTKETVDVDRSKLRVDHKLPIKVDYDKFLIELIQYGIYEV